MQPPSETDLVQRRIDGIFPNCKEIENKNVRPPLSVSVKEADMKTQKETMTRCQGE